MKNNKEIRLMDLLIGWSNYVSKLSESDEPPLPKEFLEQEAEDILNLYQKAGHFDKISNQEMIEFFNHFIIPYVIHGASGTKIKEKRELKNKNRGTELRRLNKENTKLRQEIIDLRSGLRAVLFSAKNPEIKKAAEDILYPQEVKQNG